MPMYDTATFDLSILPSDYTKVDRELIEIASLLGWSVHLTTGKSVTIISPDERKRHHFGKSKRASVNTNRIRRDIIKYADPEKLTLAAVAGANGLPRDVQLALGKALTDAESPVVDSTPERIAADNPEPTWVALEGIDGHQPSLRMYREPTARGISGEWRCSCGSGGTSKDPGGVLADHLEKVAVQTSEPKTEAEVAEEKKGRYIVMRKPVVMRGGTKHGYDSQTTIERHWSDGVIDYKCVACNYTHKNRTSPARHYANKHGVENPVSKKSYAARYEVTVTDYSHYAPRKTRIEALAALLLEKFKGTTVNEEMIEEVARESLTWVHVQSNQGTEHAAEAEELTSDEKLDRIRMLLDDGTHERFHQQVTEQAERMVQMQADLDKAIERAEAERKRAESARETLRALTELASEYADDDEKAALG